MRQVLKVKRKMPRAQQDMIRLQLYIYLDYFLRSKSREAMNLLIDAMMVITVGLKLIKSPYLPNVLLGTKVLSDNYVKMALTESDIQTLKTSLAFADLSTKDINQKVLDLSRETIDKK